jgi:hypothetical protein
MYEFTIDMVNYLSQTIQVEFENSHDRFETISQLSEKYSSQL